MLFSLFFAHSTILSCFFLFFLVIDLYFSIATAIAQIFNPTVEITTSIGIPTKEPKV